MCGGKRRPMESVISAARRILAKELTLPDECLKIDEAVRALSLLSSCA